jgi:two-component system response regulator ParR
MRQPQLLPSLLVVSEDAAIGTGVAHDHLLKGFSVAWERRADLAIERVARERPSLVLFDARGASPARWKKLRAAQRGGLILVVDEKDATAARGVRADDFVVAPVAPPELADRLDDLWRRLATMEPAGTPESLNLAGLRLDRQLREVHVLGRQVRLTWSEFELLWALASRPGELLTRDELIQRVARTSYITGRIDVHICRVRRKLGETGFTGVRLKSVRLVGYVLAVDPAA